MTENTDTQEDNRTEFVMQKQGSHIDIWAVVNGKQVFHANPPVTAAGKVIQAAAKTFITRGWEQEFNEMLGQEDDNSEGWFR